jgi:hypothetical protein
MIDMMYKYVLEVGKGEGSSRVQGIEL